ncbi:MAG: hypothetical protein HYS27_09375 [Deltaproteobacteria bacterium]|nr:hypothetical protein [Deltaproteobacteria bacterium]
MSEWTPKPKADAKTEDLNLTGEEGKLLSRVDGSTSVSSLSQSTGLPEGRVRQILKKLVATGAIEEHAAPAARPAPPARPARTESELTADPNLTTGELQQMLEPSDEGDFGEPTMDDAAPVGEMTEDADPALARRQVPAAQVAPEGAVEAQILANLDAAPGDGEPPAEAGGDAPAEASDGAPEDEAAPTEADAAGEAEEGNYRKLYETELSKLEAPEREALARSGEDPRLMALCFDPLPAVIRGIFENQRSGPSHARLVARHHRTPQGLDVVMNRAEFLRDAQVQRYLLANTMIQEPQLKRILQPKRLLEIYKVTISRELPDRNRQKARLVMRSKWSASDAEERAALVFTTEGRCLNQLTGLPFDSKTVSMLCSKTYTSSLLVQNLARFGATPPPVLAHLLRQNLVRRQQMLKTLIMQHPNCPSDAKRRT